MVKRGKTVIQINLSNRLLYTIIAIGVLLIAGVGVYAWSDPTTGVGHSLDELEPCATEGDVLQINSAGDWECAAASSGSISTNPLYVEGAITAPEGTLRDDGGGWVRTYGNTGWYSQTHAGGWYMTDSTWIRSYNSKNVYVNTLLRADGGIASGDLSPGAGNIAATGAITAGSLTTGTIKVTSQVAADDTCYSTQWGESRPCTIGESRSICHCSRVYNKWKWRDY